MTTLVRGGSVVASDGSVRASDIVIQGERIAAVEPAGSVPVGTAEVIDAGGLWVLPGVVDAHVHFDEPGRDDWEGFDSGSAAAAAGGVTTVVDMPIDCDPPTTTAARVAAKAALVGARSRVDVAIWGGLVPESVGELDAMSAAGVAGFKAFGCSSGWDDFPAADAATLRAGFEAGARHDVPVALHCEFDELGHSAASELTSLRWAAGLASSVAGARLHAVHISSAEAVDEATRWPGVTVETAPHYLTLTAADAARIGPLALCAPPIRDSANRAQLWDRVRGGRVLCVASDHSPCPPARKAGPFPFAGISGVETLLPLLSTAVSVGELDLAGLVRLTTAAAGWLRLPAKGAIAPGYDADIALVDPHARWTVGPDTLWCRHQLSPFIGRTLHGRVIRTLVRGRTVFTLDDGPCEPGGGRFLRPA